MASATVPILFAPITLRNHPGRCPGRSPAWVAQALADRNPADRRFHAAMALASYADPDAVPWVRLVDGGIVDNLGVRGSIMSEVNHYGRVLEMAGAFSPKAMSEVEHVLVIASNTQAISGRDWLRSDGDPGFRTTPTTFRLERATVDALRALPAGMLDDSAQFHSFLDRVQQGGAARHDRAFKQGDRGSERPTPINRKSYPARGEARPHPQDRPHTPTPPEIP